jgi:hypothetical protein
VLVYEDSNYDPRQTIHEDGISLRHKYSRADKQEKRPVTQVTAGSTCVAQAAEATGLPNSTVMQTKRVEGDSQPSC